MNSLSSIFNIKKKKKIFIYSYIILWCFIVFFYGCTIKLYFDRHYYYYYYYYYYYIQ